MNEADLENYTTWNKLADLYDAHFMDLELYNVSYAAFCDLLPDKRVNLFEVGCGPGNITRHILRMRPGAHYLATDFSENMVQRAQQNNPTADCQVMDVRNIGSLDQKFDGIIAGFVLPYLSPEDRERFYSDCAALLPENGILYLSFVPGDSENSGYISGSTGDRCYFHYIDFKEFTEYITQHRFEILHHWELDYSKKDGQKKVHSVLILRKE